MPCRIRHVVALFVMFAVAIAASHADVDPARALADRPIAHGHGWLAVRDDKAGITKLFHLPPREGLEKSLGALRFAPGVVADIDRVATWRDSVYIAVTPALSARSQHRILKVTAARTVLGTWIYPPDRPEVLAPLVSQPGGVPADLIAFAAGEIGVAALLRPERAEPGSAVSEPGLSHAELDALDFRLLSGPSWSPRALPWQPGAAPESPAQTAVTATSPRVHLRLWCDRDGVNLLIWPTGAAAFAADLWSARRPAPDPEQLGPPRPLIWSHSIISLAPATAGEDGAPAPARPFRPERIHFIPGATRYDDCLLFTGWARDALWVGALRPSGVIPLARLDHVPRDAWIVPMGAGAGLADTDVLANSPSPRGRLVIVWRELPVPESKDSGALRIVEVSAQTGRTLYAGPARSDGLLSAQRYQTLAVALVLATACVLAVVLRTDPKTPVRLPAGIVAADPARRFVAGAIDFALGAAAASLSLQVPFASVANPAVLITHEADLTPLLAAIAITAAYCALAESLFGRSIGKALCGCAVAAIRPGPDGGRGDGGAVSLFRPSVTQALIRNLIRWAFPLVGVFILVDALGRHPADLAARTIVVKPEPPSPQQDA